MKDFKELRVWSKAHDLTVLVYKLTRAFPRDEVYGLTSQVSRSAASIGANIAEGCGRRSDGEMARFLQIARGSASETEYHLLLAKDL
jgi:four helix bundle protein